MIREKIDLKNHVASPVFADIEMIRGTWRVDSGDPSRHILRLNKWVVGSVWVDPQLSSHHKQQWRVRCELPGIATDLGVRETLPEARLRLETAVRTWLSGVAESSTIP